MKFLVKAYDSMYIADQFKNLSNLNRNINLPVEWTVHESCQLLQNNTFIYFVKHKLTMNLIGLFVFQITRNNILFVKNISSTPLAVLNTKVVANTNDLHIFSLTSNEDVVHNKFSVT